MTTRRGFIASLAALVPAALIGAEAKQPEPQRITIRVDVNSTAFNKAVVAAVVDDYQRGSKIRDTINHA